MLCEQATIVLSQRLHFTHLIYRPLLNVVNCNLYCVSFTSFFTVPEVLTSQVQRETSVININISIGYGLEDNLQIVQGYKHDVMPAPGGEAAQH